MNLFKRCDCLDGTRCAHPYWYCFKLHRQRYRESTPGALIIPGHDWDSFSALDPVYA